MAKNNNLVATRIEDFYYDFLKKQAEKSGTSVSDMVRKVLMFSVEKWQGSIAVSLDKEQVKRLNEIAREKNMSTNDLITRIVSNYVDTYF